MKLKPPKAMRSSYFTGIMLIIFFVLFISTGCSPDDPAVPKNPLNGRTTAIFNPGKRYGTLTDIDGNIYKTIVIGEQTWMAENLRVTRYRNGDELSNITDDAQWPDLTQGAYCNYGNTLSLDTIATYGRMYNWYAVADSRGIAPEGWRVAAVHDWITLIDYLGGTEIAGSSLKEKGATHWKTPNESDNGSGFTALPGGSSRNFPGESRGYYNMGYYGIWWTSSEFSAEAAGFLYLYSYDSIVYTGVNFKRYGYSIRCIKE